MRIIQLYDDTSAKSLYPQKRKYFSIYFMGYASDLSSFTNELSKHIPEEWPVIVFVGRADTLSPTAIDHIKQVSAMSNVAVLWTASDTDADFSINPYMWSAQIGRFVSSNKRCFFGSSVPNFYRPVTAVVGGEKWYLSLQNLCEDLSSIVKEHLLEVVTLKSNLSVRSGVR